MPPYLQLLEDNIRRDLKAAGYSNFIIQRSIDDNRRIFRDCDIPDLIATIKPPEDLKGAFIEYFLELKRQAGASSN